MGTAFTQIGGGKVIQVVSTTLTTTFTGVSTSLADITGLTLSITPTSSSNKIFLIYSVQYIASAGNASGIALLRDAIVVGAGATAGSRTSVNSSAIRTSDLVSIMSSSNQYFDSPATTSATTYKLQYYVQAGTFYLNRTVTDADAANTSRASSTITAIEINA